MTSKVSCSPVSTYPAASSDSDDDQDCFDDSKCGETVPKWVKLLGGCALVGMALPFLRRDPADTWVPVRLKGANTLPVARTWNSTLPAPTYNHSWAQNLPYRLQSVSPVEVSRSPRLAAQRLRQQRLVAMTMAEGTLPVTDVKSRIIKRPKKRVQQDDKLVVFSMFSADGTIPGDTQYLIEQLRANRDGLYLIIATDIDLAHLSLPASLLQICDGVMGRANHGLDFSGWAHALNEFTQLWEAAQLTFANDSNYGPLNPPSLTNLYRRIDDSPNDFIGLTESEEYRPHYQSFFLVFKRAALQSMAMQKFFLDDLYSLAQKNDVIDAYELTLLKTMQDASISHQAIFAMKAVANHHVNPSLEYAFELTRRGYPFFKKAIVKSEGLRQRRYKFNFEQLRSAYKFDLESALKTGDPILKSW